MLGRRESGEEREKGREEKEEDNEDEDLYDYSLPLNE